MTCGRCIDLPTDFPVSVMYVRLFSFPGVQKPLEQYGTSSVAAATANGGGDDDDDDDFDMFGDQTEEEVSLICLCGTYSICSYS